MIIRRAATIFEDYRIARQQAYFSSEKRTVPHPTNTTNNNNNNNSGATIQEIDENGVVVKEKTINKKMKKAQSGTSLPAVSHSQSQGTGVVEIIAQNEEMKAAFKRLGDMLSPYLTEDHADVRIHIKCQYRATKVTVWKCMYRLKCRTISKPCGQNKSVT